MISTSSQKESPFIQQILMSRDWAGGWLLAWKEGRWAGSGSSPTSPAVAASHWVLTVSLTLSSAPLFLPSHLPTFTLLFSLYCLPPTMLPVLTLDMNDHRRGHLPEIGDCAVLAPYPGFGRTPGEGLLGQELLLRRESVDSFQGLGPRSLRARKRQARE